MLCALLPSLKLCVVTILYSFNNDDDDDDDDDDYYYY